jgi:two-component system response regulator RegX3
MSGPTVLIVDDEMALQESLAYAFRREGFNVKTATSAAEGSAKAQHGGADVVVLDLMLPDGDGCELCRQLRAGSEVPIVMLTARDQAADRVRGFEVGADDYVTKPFNTRELIARVRAVLRRDQQARALLASDEALLERIRAHARSKPLAAVPGRDDCLLVGDVELLDDGRTARVGGRTIELEPAEYRLVEALGRQPGRVVTRSELARQLWGAATEEHVLLLEAVFRATSAKVDVGGARPLRLVAVTGIGYRLG